MKQTLLLFLGLFLSLSAARADVSFDPNTKYRLSCAQYPGGAVVLGTNHGSSAYLYYDTSGSYADDAWWYIRPEGSGYTLVNAQSGTYITYYDQRIENVAKGLILSESSQGSSSQWTFVEQGGYLAIQSVEKPAQWFNLRTDGTYLLGTYEGSGSQNELFTIYDAAGNEVTGSGDQQGQGGDYETQGLTAQGEYWERTGLEQPVVYTTDTTDPVLYSILNLRRNQYVAASGNTLVQTEDDTQRTQFYFVENGDGVQIFTQEGQYVSTQYSSYGFDSKGVSVVSGTPSGHIWGFSWYADEKTPGYALEKLDNLTSGGGWQSQQSQYKYWNDYDGSYIGLYSLDEGSTFVFASADARHTAWLAENGITFDGSVTPPAISNFNNTLDSIRLADKQLVYDQSSRSYLHPLPTTLRSGGDFTAKFSYKLKPAYEGYSVTLEGQTADTETGELILAAPSGEKDYTLALLDTEGNTAAQATLRFTFLPIVEVTVPSCNGNYYTTGSIRVTDADQAGHDSVFVAAYKYRGATAQSYDKKAFAIKLRDAAGNSVDRKFLDLRSDNNWILDAMAVDLACMRNRVATDLWNDFSTKPYYADREKKARTGTRGKFVEVFYNGKYHGLYCMTEKLDRKQLKLKKYTAASASATGEEEVHGLLYKASDWSYEVFMGHEQNSEYFPGRSPQSYTNRLGVETWRSFELKYPDYEEEAVDWAPLWEAVNFVATSGQTEFEEGIKEYFDYPVVKDYYLFIDLLLATDNHGKNMFYFVYDKAGAEGNLLGLCPWDLDGVFGQNYYGNTYYTEDATQDLDAFLWQYEHGQHTMYYKLRKSTTLGWNEELAARYAELRPTYFEPDHLADRFATYAKLFADSRADSREEKRWSSYHDNLQEQAEYAENWVRERIAALDEKYGFDPVASAVNEAVAESYFHAEGGRGAIGVTTGKAQAVRVYTLAGSLVRTATLRQGFNEIGGLSAGIYIVGGQKVIVE